MFCPICGIQKSHYRLYGYRCHNPEHAQQEHEITQRHIKRYGFKRSPVSCANCGHECKLGETYCSRCGAFYEDETDET